MVAKNARMIDVVVTHPLNKPMTRLDGDVALGYLPHVESHSWNHVFIKLSTLQLRQKAMKLMKTGR